MNIDTYTIEDISHLTFKEILGRISRLLTVFSVRRVINN